ncbi:uncharacterized protein LOC114541139 [Dendronephthya gigantea]|uniref:uncharacterized protein LOC114541139 n=1 Tax=Dendronephthya gigantea TaxID=151771 RepID=UPI00106B2803|nr:uncharacterized protein LOC114541139 [Dendronephthya gigantea]
MQAEWAKEAFALLEKGKVPTFKNLTSFVTVKAKLASSAFGKLIGAKPQDDKYPKLKRNPHGTSFAAEGRLNVLKCYHCEKIGHSLEKCFSFRKESLNARKDVVRKEKLCNLCLGKGHFERQCRRKETCMVAECGQRHHSLLHPVQQLKEDWKPPEVEEQVDKNNKPECETNNGHCTATGAGRPRVRLRVIPVTVRGIDETHEVQTYALLDDGSDVSLCHSSLVRRLGITGVPTTFSLTTVNEEAKENRGEEVRLIVSDLDGSENVDITRAWTVSNLPISKRSIPTAGDVSGWSHLDGIVFPELENENVSIIIGSDVPEAHWVLEQRRGQRKEPYAVRTPLGWTLMGPIGTETEQGFQINFIRKEDNTLQEQVERMFRMDFSESDFHLGKGMSFEDQRALNIMESSAKKVNGHYEISLPWRDGSPSFPNNRKMAEKRLISLQRRLKKDTHLKENYRNVIEGYLEKGYAAKVPEERRTSECESTTGRVWYLPHHPVFHAQKPEKVRVVFDCAARFGDTSLNDQLLRGPDLTNTLIGVLIRFRQEPVALTSDVEAMFHQVRVNSQDSEALRFLWWPDADLSKPPQDYSMQVHLFGATSSPSCANFSLRKTSQDHQYEFDKETVNTVEKNFYVDDCLKSVATVEKATRLASQLRAMLAKGGFHLTKWASNSREVLASIPPSERASPLVNLDFESFPELAALGVIWDVETDTFRFRIVEGNNVKTRRAMLSFISSMYDPFGIASPFILPGRQILQRLCSINYDWDEEIPEEELSTWNIWQKSLAQLSTVAIPRCIKLNLAEKLSDVQLHTFADASRLGYGAVSYLRLVDVNNHLIMSFLAGKSRVTPTKQVTIPRLELTAAVLAVKLSHQLEEELEISVDRIVFWTDSTIVLQYLNNESTRFQTFVANRLAVIHDLSKPSQWRYVETAFNPADSASRGINPTDLRKTQAWLDGPEFLQCEEDRWPKNPDEIKQMPDEHLEWRRTAQINEITAEKRINMTDKLLERYSSWYALQKGVAWLLCFLTFLRQKKHIRIQQQALSGSLLVREIRAATTKIVKYVQRQCFQDEIRTLATTVADGQKSSKVVTENLIMKRSRLRKLNPILVEGVLRVGGRLERSSMSFDAKHPMILPQHHHVTELIIRDSHVSEGHIGPTQVLATIRQTFWIIHGPTEALLQGQRVNDECLLTFMAETERILNDRPLTRQEDNPNDLEPLTPNKLLLLRSEQPPPLGSWVTADKFSKRWRQAQQLADAFWKRWVKEYLPLLQERQKWLTEKRNLQPQDLVLLLDERLSREQWPLGIVEEVYPDKNGRSHEILDELSALFPEKNVEVIQSALAASGGDKSVAASRLIQWSGVDTGTTSTDTCTVTNEDALGNEDETELMRSTFGELGDGITTDHVKMYRRETLDEFGPPLRIYVNRMKEEFTSDIFALYKKPNPLFRSKPRLSGLEKDENPSDALKTILLPYCDEAAVLEVPLSGETRHVVIQQIIHYNVIGKRRCELTDLATGMNERSLVNFLKAHSEMIKVVFPRECESVIDKEQLKNMIEFENGNH